MATSTGTGEVTLQPLPPLKPELNQRAWASIPHPTLPLLATCHSKAVTVYSLSTLSSHSTLTGGHARSVRSAAWKPAQPPHKLCLATGSFDSTAALWRWDGDNVALPDPSSDPASAQQQNAGGGANLEVEITAASVPARGNGAGDDVDSDKDDAEDWEFSLVLEGHESEVKSAAFSPSAQYLATCSRDKTVWIWEDVGADEADDEWETVAVLNEHEADVKCVAWCPDVPGRASAAAGKFGAEVLASSSYDDTVRVWREDGDGEWVCVAVLEGHEGTVWGLQWESDPERKRFPRLLSFSADKTIRVWTLKEDDEEEEVEGGDGKNPLFRPGLGGIPNTMRRPVREEWECTAILPAVHTRDVYSASWSATSGLVASTGSDGVIAVYKEGPSPADGNAANEADASETTAPQDKPQSGNWRVLTTLSNGHGPYEINHITWCRRFDSDAENRGIEEMLVTTGDNGVIKPWKVVTS